MKSKKKLNLRKWIIFFIFIFWGGTFFCFCQNTKLKVNGNINIHQNQTLRFKPVPQSTTPPSNPSQGDLYFDGSSLFYYDGSEWQAIAQEGNVFFNSNDNTLYYYDGEKWKVIKGGGGQKTVATRIVAAYDSLDTTCNGGVCSNPRADYTCDGTDDQEEIQKAIDDLGSSGGVVYLLEGTYNLSSPIVFDDGSSDGIDDSNKSLIGTGAGTVLNMGPSGKIYVHSDSATVSRIFISRLRITRTEEADSTRGEIEFDGVEKSIVTEVWIEGDSAAKVFASIFSSNSRQNIFSSNFLMESGAFLALRLQGNSNDNIVSANQIKNFSMIGVQIFQLSDQQCFNNIILGNIINNGGLGVEIEFSNFYNSVIANNFSLNSAGVLSQGKYDIIFSNIISESHMLGIGLQSGDSYRIISSNQVITNKREGIKFISSYYNNIVGNIISNNIKDGIKIDGSYNLLSSNRILDNSGKEINIINGGGNYLVGNYVNGTITDSGTNTTYTQKEKITIERKEVNLNNGDTLEVTTSPRGYVALKANQAITLDATKAISDGKAQGDLLILEGTSDTNTITILNGANVKLGSISRVLGKEDTLTLIWNGNDWMEMDYANN